MTLTKDEFGDLVELDVALAIHAQLYALLCTVCPALSQAAQAAEAHECPKDLARPMQ